MQHQRAAIPNSQNRRDLLKQATALVAGTAAGLEGARAQSQPASSAHMFPDFKSIRIQTSGATINVVTGGDGPPVLLMHGYPQSHVEWHKLAPQLAKEFTLVIADLRGYGDSSKPADGEKHFNYSKRAMALDQAEVMTHLGFEKFAVVGHDRGGRVAHRLALDHANRVTKMAVLDIVPTYKLYHNVTKEFASAYYHWFFLIQPAPFPETLIGNSIDFFMNRSFRPLMPKAVTEEAFAEYLRVFRDPATLHAACEDYRAGAGIDLEHDETDMNRKVECPLLALWGERGPMNRMYDVLASWRERAANVSGKALPGGHFLPEEVPDQTLAELRMFLRS
jgi:haloacetate dehalogenase